MKAIKLLLWAMTLLTATACETFSEEQIKFIDNDNNQSGNANAGKSPVNSVELLPQGSKALNILGAGGGITATVANPEVAQAEVIYARGQWKLCILGLAPGSTKVTVNGPEGYIGGDLDVEVITGQQALDRLGISLYVEYGHIFSSKCVSDADYAKKVVGSGWKADWACNVFDDLSIEPVCLWGAYDGVSPKHLYFEDANNPYMNNLTSYFVTDYNMRYCHMTQPVKYSQKDGSLTYPLSSDGSCYDNLLYVDDDNLYMVTYSGPFAPRILVKYTRMTLDELQYYQKTYTDPYEEIIPQEI